MNERIGRLRALINSSTWRDLNAILNESVQSMLQEAVASDEDSQAVRLFHEARAAQKFAFKFVSSVENTAQPVGDE